MISVPETLELAVKHHQGGRLSQAEQLYRQVLDVDSGNVNALNLLGLLAHQSGRNSQAVEVIRTALHLRPDFAEAHNNLGMALRALGNLEEAIASWRQALRLKPQYAKAHNNLGLGLHDQGNLEEAAVSLEQALRLEPGFAEAYNNLGVTLQEMGRLDEAIAALRQAIRLVPEYAEAHYNAGNCLFEQERLEEAQTCFQEAVRLRPSYAEAHGNLGPAFREQGKLKEAEASLLRALHLQPELASAWLNLGVVRAELGELAEAERCFRQALKRDPGYAEVWYELAILLRDKLPESDFQEMRRLLAAAALPDGRRAGLCFGLAQVLDARQIYDEAAEQARQANALTRSARQKRGRVYEPGLHQRWTERMLAAFTPAYFRRVHGHGVDSQRPIFVVGLPRSGSTLTEQILASHSAVFGAGELHLGASDFKMLFPDDANQGQEIDDLARLDMATVQRQAHWHLEQLRKLNETALRVVDKMPENYLYLGLLATLFPRARFIHCRRDLRDVAVSCWMTSFRQVPWSNDIGHIAARLRAYQEVMEHWRRVLPVPMLEISYEDIVADLEREARRLVAWCGLEWEPSCLRFYEGKRPVRTASKLQVRQPIYSHSVGRWKNYEQALAALFAELP